MNIVRTTTVLQQVVQDWRGRNLRIGFVPTMGALHAGHLSLVDLARQHADKVIVSIFVNPTQFAPHEDFDRYPRQEAQDAAMLERAQADKLWLPAVDDLYPNGPAADRMAAEAAQGLESDFRPHFFNGVASVVWRLFDAVKPDIAVFGEKDYQQLMVIKDMVAAEKLSIDIIPGPIIRDEFGLALSSRNAYLSAQELAVARRLNVILNEVKDLIRKDPSPAAQDDSLRNAKQKLLQAGFAEVQYLEPRWGRLLAAVKLGNVRLIDNVAL